ncbi:MAG TPA: aminotransferase class I/II-fold pyridoxal phosphate-dependent enzyme [Polyangiaceae bacterium]|nr:aminotransferase class I/II-fold pyridoxal phosphate-dependent enzyme [Polyangiaceae bacterium]
MSDPKHKSTTSTDAVHAGIERGRAHHTLTPSIAQTATYTFENTATLERYMRGEDPDPEREEYGRYGNPTVRELERRVAALEGAEDAVAFSSGMAATSTALLALLKAGDHVVLFRDCYRRTRQLVTQTLLRFGIEHTVVDAGDLVAMEAAIKPNTRLVVTESPTNPLNFCVDLEKLTSIVKSKGRIRTLVDSTFATPVNSLPLSLGIDLVLHSATKYLSGHNDVLGGVVAGPSHIISLLRDTRGIVGSVLDPHAAFLIMRGMKTLALRVARQNQSALALARELERHPKVERVHYPWLESHPSFPIATTQMSGGGAVVSFVVRGGRAAASRVVDAARIPQIAASLGGVESLIEQPAIMSFFELTDEDLSKIGIDPALIRLSVGIEETSDLVQDLLSALDKA